MANNKRNGAAVKTNTAQGGMAKSMADQLKAFAKNTSAVTGAAAAPAVEQEKTRKIFLTTLSTLGRPALSYYRNDGKYFTGHYTNEPGAKYILSTEVLDKIVVMGSAQTYKETVSKTIPGLGTLEQFDAPKAAGHFENQKYDRDDALEYFLLQTVQYLKNGEDSDDAMFNSIPDERKKEIEQLIQAYVEKQYAEKSAAPQMRRPSESFAFLSENEDPKTTQKARISAVLKENIQKEYADRDALEKFHLPEGVRFKAAETLAAPSAEEAPADLSEYEAARQALVALRDSLVDKLKSRKDDSFLAQLDEGLSDMDASVSDDLDQLRMDVFKSVYAKEDIFYANILSIDLQLEKMKTDLLKAQTQSLKQRSEELIEQNQQHAEAAGEIEKQARDAIDAFTEQYSALMEVAQKYRKELDDIRTRRLDVETDYAMYQLYQKLNPDKKLKGLQNNLNAAIAFVPLGDTQETRYDSIQHCVDEIQKSFPEEKVELYIDVQGGARTDDFERNAIFSMLSSEVGSKIEVKKVIATDYERNNFCNAVADQTDRYKITELVGGMTAFINYGKAGQIKAGSNPDKKTEALINAMQSIDAGLSVCDVTAFKAGIQALKKAITAQNKDKSVKDAFSLLQAGIQRDYGKLLEGREPDTIEMIQWALKKQMIQQAITLVESQIPAAWVRDGLVQYDTVIIQSKRKIWNSKLRKTENYKKYWSEAFYFTKGYLNDIFYTLNLLDAKPRPEEINEQSIIVAHNNEKAVTYNCDRSDFIDLYKNYSSLCKMRNQLNHAAESGNRADVDGIKEAIENFVIEYVSLRDNE